MTPYEGALTKKLNQAVELSQTLSKLRKMVDCEVLQEEATLQTILQQIDAVTHQFNSQLCCYQKEADLRRRLAIDSDDSIKQLTSRLWKDIGYQFKSGTVANDLLKVLCYKIQRFPLPSFPISRRKPFLDKNVHLYEDSYRLLGQYFSWLIELLPIVNFTTIRPPYYLQELNTIASRYKALTEQIKKEAETLRNLQLTRIQLYKQLNQTLTAARGRLLLYKREIREQAVNASR